MMTMQSRYLASGTEAEAFTQMWFGGLIELVGGTLIALGLFTPWAAFLASGTMAVAYIQFHWKLDFGKNFFPALNQGGPALIYSFLFLYTACKGSGIASVDSLLSRRDRPVLGS
jgi:putative oxidoreductase